MNGLDKILAEIMSDYESICFDIRSRANVRCEEILKESQAIVDKINSEGEIEAKKVYDEIVIRAESSADLEARSVVLKTKQEIISKMLENARLYFCNLPGDEYFELICKMISKYSEYADGIIRFSENDLKRLPSGFEDRIKECSKGYLTLSNYPVTIDGGFVLVYNLVEVNCSFSSMFAAESERFGDEISRVLFS